MAQTDYFEFLLSDFAGTAESHYALRAGQCLSVYHAYHGGAPSRILDIGAGPGALVNAFRQSDAIDAVGMEPSGQAVDYAQKHYGDYFWKHSLGAGLSDMDLERYGNQDLIVCFEVFQMLSYFEYPHFMDEVARLLRPGGLFLLMLPNFAHPYLFPYLAYSDPYTKSYTTPESLYRVMRAHPTLQLLKIMRWNSASHRAVIQLRTLFQKAGEFILSRLTPFVFQTPKRLNPELQDADLFLSSHIAAVLKKRNQSTPGGAHVSHH